MIKRLTSFIEKKIALFSDHQYLLFLRKKGISIGNNCTFLFKETYDIDFQRTCLITIGNNVTLNKYFTLMTHDISYHVFRHTHNDMVSGWSKVKIGNNVYFGWHCSVLRGSTIGDNCIIGYGSVVMGNIPSNSVAAGTPARVICSIDEYYSKRKEKMEKEAIDYAQCIRERLHREPVISDFWDEFPLFLDGDKELPELPYKTESLLKEGYKIYQQKHKAKYKNFDEFIAQTKK